MTDVPRRITRLQARKDALILGLAESPGQTTPTNEDAHSTKQTVKARQPTTAKSRRSATARDGRPKRSSVMQDYVKTTSACRIPPISAPRFGLIQEKVSHSLYELLVAAMLWNRTRGSQARPVFEALVRQYPTPEHLAGASAASLADLIRPIGLYNERARRFLAFARAWVDRPPSSRRRYRRMHYPGRGDGVDVGPGEVLGEEDAREGWEVAHLPGVGPYALDSFRIFFRDVLRGRAGRVEGLMGNLKVEGGDLKAEGEDLKAEGEDLKAEGEDLKAEGDEDFEPEWKRVVPADKELKAYIRWRWLREGFIWDPETGSRVAASPRRMEQEALRTRSLSPEWI